MTLMSRGKFELLIAELRDKAASCTDAQTQVGFTPFISDALRQLSDLEACARSKSTKLHMSKSAARGTKSGRHRCMTPERIAVATRMLMNGASGLTVHRAAKGLPGPNLAQSTYYLWQKSWKETVLEGQHTEPETNRQSKSA